MAVDQVERSEERGMSVLVCGAGVGGLMSALECWRRGFNVRVFKRAPQRQTAGDSFMIGPTAIRSFQNWPAMSRRNQEIAYHPLMANHTITGERVNGPFKTETLLFSNGSAPPPKVYRHSRTKFHAMLVEQLASIGVQIEYGKEVTSYSEDLDRGCATVTLKDGSRAEADLVIAADGVRGKSWELVVGEPVPAKPMGDAVFRVSFPVEILERDPVLAERFQLTENGDSVIELWNGAGIHVVFWRNQDNMQVGIMHPDQGTAEESWSHRVKQEDVLNLTKTIPGWPEIGDRVIRAIPEDLLMDFRIMWRDPQPKCTSPGGRVVQVGDAAHTFLPNSANGATQAIEDAVSLAACLSMAKTKDEIPQAARVHNLLRFERISCMQAFGVTNKKKNTTETKNKEDAKKNKVMIPKWILNHDPEAYALEKYQEASGHLSHGTPFKNTNTPPGMEYVPWTLDTLLDAQERGERTVLDGDWS